MVICGSQLMFQDSNNVSLEIFAGLMLNFPAHLIREPSSL